MTDIIRFFIESVQGFMLLAAIPVLCYWVYHTWKLGGIQGLLDWYHQLGKTPAKDASERDPFREDPRMRAAHPRPIRSRGNKWFEREAKIIRSFSELSDARDRQFKDEMTPYLVVLLLEYFLCVPFIGHLGCILWNTVIPKSAVMLLHISADYLPLHFQLAIFYAGCELVLHVIDFVLRYREEAIFSFLLGIKVFLCEELGTARGEEAARFIALLMDFCLDDDDKKSLLKMARTAKSNGASGKASLHAIVRMYESKRGIVNAPQSIPMTEEGQRIYDDILRLIED